MNIHAVSEITGLSRAQIDLLISRHGYAPYGKAVRGKGREFVPADAFDLAIIAQLRACGLSNEDAVAAATGALLREVDNDFMPSCLIPSYLGEIDQKEIAYLIFTAPEMEADLVREAELNGHLSRADASIAINVTKIIKKIEAGNDER